MPELQLRYGAQRAQAQNGGGNLTVSGRQCQNAMPLRLEAIRPHPGNGFHGLLTQPARQVRFRHQP